MPDASLMPGLFAQQWRLARMQLVNWGTFCGYHDLPLAQGRADGSAPVVMITGESGTGKSTIFDAKTAVLQRNNVRFNAASNSVARGRARGGTQRSVFSYVLGKQDDVLDEATGEERESFLRTTATPQWSAVVLTFADTSGATFCCARFWYLPQSGQEADLKTYLLTSDEDLDPRLLGAALTQAPGKRTFAEVYPAAATHETVSGFLTFAYERLGIGAGGEGDNAMKLHERIQGGYPVTDVDALFKELVIDEPTTYGYAEKALAAFDEGEGVWRQMDEIRRKIEALTGIRETHETYERQTERAALLESMVTEGAAAATADSRDAIADPLGLVLARHRAQVLERAANEAEEIQARQEEKLARSSQELATQQHELDQVRREVQENGGDALDRRRDELADARATLAARRRTRQELGELLGTLRRDLPASEAAYAGLAQDAQDLLAKREDANRQLNERQVEIGMQVRDLRARGEKVRQELDYYRQHHVRITPQMAEARQAMADALGVDPGELPYAAELIDMADGQEASAAGRLRGLPRAGHTRAGGRSAAGGPLPRHRRPAAQAARHLHGRGAGPHLQGRG